MKTKTTLLGIALNNITVSPILSLALCALLSLPLGEGWGGASFAQNIGINSTGATPDASALLDINANPGNNKGLLIPRVALTTTTSNAPIGVGIALSLMVFNTATVNDVTTGYYYWDGTLWQRFQNILPAASNDWKLLGNAGTVDGTHFIGTTDNIPINFRVGNQKSGRIDLSGRVFFGYQAGNSNTATLTTGIGYQTLKFNTSGTNNTAIGAFALYSNTTGFGNTSTGNQALYANSTGNYNTANGYLSLRNTSGSNNTAIGMQSLENNTSGSNNMASGYQALLQNSTGIQNTANGSGALRNNTTGHYNTANGFNALYSNTTTQYNTATGYFALRYNTTGYWNTATGSNALRQNTSGIHNTADGMQALQNNTTGSQNTACGFQALAINTIGNSNTAIGWMSLYGISGTSTGNYNTATGRQTLYQLSTGSYNTANGYIAGSSITTGNYNTAIGYNAQVPVATNSNQVRIGNTSVTYAGVQVGWTITSDKRFKSDIQNSNLGLDFITKLRPVSYIRNNDAAKKTEYGFIAQELEETLNSSGAPDNGIISKDDEGMYGVRYNDLLSPMVKAMQELNDSLKLNIESLKLENQKLMEAQQKQYEAQQKLIKRIEALETK